MVETFESIFNKLDFTTGITRSSPSIAYIGKEVSDCSLIRMYTVNTNVLSSCKPVKNTAEGHWKYDIDIDIPVLTIHYRPGFLTKTSTIWRNIFIK